MSIPSGKRLETDREMKRKAAEPRVIPSDPQKHKMAQALGRSLVKPVPNKSRKSAVRPRADKKSR